MSRIAQEIGAVYNRLIPPGQDLQWVGEPIFWLAGRRGQHSKRLLDAQRILVIRPDRIGDVVLSSAFLRELRRVLSPGARVTLLTRPEVRTLVERCPYVDEIATYAWERPWNRSRWQRYRRAFVLARQQLWERRFDLAIVPRWDVDQDNAKVIAYLSGARHRAGFVQDISLARAAGGNFNRLLTHPCAQSVIKHEVEHSLDLVRFLGGSPQDDRLELWLNADDEAFARDFLARHGYREDTPLVALAPATSEAKRNWPIERFAALAAWLHAEMGAQVLLIGGPADRPLLDTVQRALNDRGFMAAGAANLRQTAALLHHCQLYVGGDTGPMHMAAAAGAWVVEISCHPISGSVASPNAPERFGPWGGQHIVLQPHVALPPCDEQCVAADAHCITQIELGAVKQAVVAQLQRSHKMMPIAPAASVI